MRRSCMGTRDGSHARTPSLVQTRPSLARPRRVDAHSPSCAQTSSRSDMTKKNRYSRKRRKAIRRQRGFPSDDANIIGRTRSRESVSERGAPTRSSLARTRDARTTSPPSQPRSLETTAMRSMRSPVLLLLLGLLLALTPGAEAGKLGKLLLWKHWGKSHGGHHGRSGGVAATKSGGWSGDSKSHGGDSSGGGKHQGDMSHMDTDDDSDDSQDWWHSKSWRRESWWGKHMSRHGGWKMRTSGRTFGNGQGIRAAKCMLRECGMELQKCRFDMTCRQGVKCAVGEDPSRALSGFPRRVPSGLSAPVSSQPHVFPRRSLSLKPRKKQLTLLAIFGDDPHERLRIRRRRRQPRVLARLRPREPQRRVLEAVRVPLGLWMHARDVRPTKGPRRREKRLYDAATGWR